MGASVGERDAVQGCAILGPCREPAEIVAIGGDLEPSTLIAAYAQGIFPMKVEDVLAWWSPDPRGILPLDGFRLSRSLRRALPRSRSASTPRSPAVMRACGDPRRPHGWIDDDFVAAYCRLHELGWAHSVEAWQTAKSRRWCLRRAHRRVVRGGVDVPPRHRRVEGRALGRGRAAAHGRRRRCSTCSGRRPHLESLGAVDVSRASTSLLLDAAVGSRDG